MEERRVVLAQPLSGVGSVHPVPIAPPDRVLGALERSVTIGDAFWLEASAPARLAADSWKGTALGQPTRPTLHAAQACKAGVHRGVRFGRFADEEQSDLQPSNRAGPSSLCRSPPTVVTLLTAAILLALGAAASIPPRLQSTASPRAPLSPKLPKPPAPVPPPPPMPPPMPPPPLPPPSLSPQPQLPGQTHEWTDTWTRYWQPARASDTLTIYVQIDKTGSSMLKNTLLEAPPESLCVLDTHNIQSNPYGPRPDAHPDPSQMRVCRGSAVLIGPGVVFGSCAAVAPRRCQYLTLLREPAARSTR